APDLHRHRRCSESGVAPGKSLLPRSGPRRRRNIRRCQTLPAGAQEARHPHGRRRPEMERRLEALHAQLHGTGNNPEVFYEIGNIYLRLQEYGMALENFEKALHGDTGSTKFKVAYAQAGLKLRESETIAVK